MLPAPAQLGWDYPCRVRDALASLSIYIEWLIPFACQVFCLPRPAKLSQAACLPNASQKCQQLSNSSGLCLQYALEMVHCLEVLHITGLVGIFQKPAADKSSLTIARNKSAETEAPSKA